MESIYDGFKLRQDEIRLLELQPAEQFSAEIRCRLSKAVLSDPPSYQALSYVWGNPNEKVPISVNDRVFNVTTNLSAGLRHIRRQDSSIQLWVDAICINQQDIPERNRQVRLMRDIYMQAEQALVWLGESNEDSDLAMDLIRRWSTPIPEGILRVSREGVAEVLKRVSNPFEFRDWEALRKFFERPYWERSWILQEITFSKQATLVCGLQKIDWQALSDAMYPWGTLDEPENFSSLNGEQLSMVDLSNFNVATKIQLWRLERTMPERLNPRLHLMEYTRHSKATDPRDKIYAFLGFEDIRKLGLKQDYAKSVERVYGEFVQAFVEKERKLNVLTQAGIGWPSIEPVLDLPSWVPDFRGSEHRRSLGTFRAGGDELPAVAIPEDLRVLTTRGVIYDTIGGIVYDGGDSHVVKNLWLDLALSPPGLHPTGIPYLQAYFRTVVADYSSNGCDQHPFTDAESKRRFFNEAAGILWWLGKWAVDNKTVPARLLDLTPEALAEIEKMNDYIQNFMLWSGYVPDVLSKQAFLAPFLGKPGSSQIVWPEDDDLNRGRQCSAIFASHIISVCMDRSFFVSKKGYLGLAPQEAKIGDLICVVLGCDKPLIIRKVNDHHVLIGDSYVYGIMNGEVIRDVDKGSEKTQEIIFH